MNRFSDGYVLNPCVVLRAIVEIYDINRQPFTLYKFTFMVTLDIFSII